MFGETPFADLPFSDIIGGLVEVTVNGVSMTIVIGCFHVSAWAEVAETPVTWSSISDVSTNWSGVSVTTTIWEEIC